MYWLLISSFAWAHTFGSYETLEDCQKAAETAPWYVSAACIPQPERDKPAQPHKH